MSMLAGLYTLSDANIARVQEDPLLLQLVYGQGDTQFYDRLRQREMPGWFDRLRGRKAPARSDPATFVLAEGEVMEADLGSAWHGIHYLLTRSDWEGEPPLDFIARGGGDAGDDARTFNAGQVRAIDAALQPIDAQVLTQRFDPADMERLEIYPGIWSDPANEALEYCLENFAQMKDVIRHAAQQGLGVVISIG